MKFPRSLAPALLVMLALLVPAPAAAGGLDSFIGEVNIHAGADLGAFKADLRATFGVSNKEVDGLFEVMVSAADVYMTLRIGQVSRQPIDRVVTEYRRHKGQGWGVIAKNLGIKPGSAEFHALKAGKMGERVGHGKGKTGKPGKGKKS